MKLKPLAAALVTAGVLASGSTAAWSVSELLQRPTSVAAAAPASVAPIPVPAGTIPNYRAIVQSYGPAVVGVTVEGMRKVDGQPDLDALPPFFRDMPGFRFGPRGERPYRGQGSGFIISADGLVLTNAHVVQQAKEVTVKLSDRREYRAKVLGSDPATDIAVLRIDAKDLPVVSLGDPKQVQVGDHVMAIGAPFGFEQTATQGIVSAKGRSLPGDSFVPFIQTDAAVNPGNSGGPLFDANGRVIGINAQIFSRSGGFQGLAFAIPIDVALNVKEQIVKHGKVEHARLGVTIQNLNQSLAESFGLKTPDGALVSSVAPGSAAAKVDLKPGDVITRIDGQRVQMSGDVSSRVGMARPGQKMQLTVWRDKSERELAVTLGAAEDVASAESSAERRSGALGLALRPLDPAEKQQAQTEHGLLVEDVGGAAARAGIRPGDVVLSLNGKPVKSVEQISDVLESKPKHVALLIQRNDQRIFVPITLG